MISRKLLRKSLRTLSVFLIFYLLLVQLPLKGIVLCVGEDGHIALEEASSENQCGQIFKDAYNDTRLQHEIDQRKYSENHCGDCKDLVITEVYDDQILSSYDFNSQNPDYRIQTLLSIRELIPGKHKNSLNDHTALPHITPVSLSTKLIC